MCKIPKIIWIKSKAGNKHRLVVPCGKCSDCQNSKRAQFVARCKYELLDNPYCYFCTFTYDDQHLVNLYYKKSYVVNDYKRKVLLKYLKNHNGEVFAYDKFLLNKDDAQILVKDIRYYFNRNFINLFPKYYLTGEYGTVSHRPHFHCLLFFNKPFENDSLKQILLRFWHNGNVDVRVANDACINYIAKHQIKQDDGSKYQRKLSPIFSLQSKKIGISMLNDFDVLSNWSNDLRFGRIPGTSYKYALPRYIVKYFKKDGYSDEELEKMDITGFERLKYNMSLKGIELSEHMIRTNRNFFRSLKVLVNEDFKQKTIYKVNKFTKKYITLKRSCNSDLTL